MVLKAGSMRRRVTFQSQSSTQDSVGQKVDTWTLIGRRWVSIEPLNGREYFAASGEKSEVTTRIRVRYDATIAAVKPYDRVLHGSTTYDIVSVIVPEERNQEIVLMTRRAG